jgi:PAS domain-containing protein
MSIKRLQEITDILNKSEYQTLVSLCTIEDAVDLGKIGIWDWYEKGDSLRWNKWMYTLFGYEESSLDAVTYNHFIDKVALEEREGVNKEIEICRKTKKKYDISYTTIHGTRIRAIGGWIFEDGKPWRMVGVCLQERG